MKLRDIIDNPEKYNVATGQKPRAALKLNQRVACHAILVNVATGQKPRAALKLEYLMNAPIGILHCCNRTKAACGIETEDLPIVGRSIVVASGQKPRAALNIVWETVPLVAKLLHPDKSRVRH